MKTTPNTPRSTSPTRDDLPQGLRDDFDMDLDSEGDEAPADLSSIIGGATGEPDREVVAGGWAGTDDATSTAPSDLGPTTWADTEGDGPEENAVPHLSERIDHSMSDIKGTPVDESRDWETDPIVAER